MKPEWQDTSNADGQVVSSKAKYRQFTARAYKAVIAGPDDWDWDVGFLPPGGGTHYVLTSGSGPLKSLAAAQWAAQGAVDEMVLSEDERGMLDPSSPVRQKHNWEVAQPCAAVIEQLRAEVAHLRKTIDSQIETARRLGAWTSSLRAEVANLNAVVDDGQPGAKFGVAFVEPPAASETPGLLEELTALRDDLVEEEVEAGSFLVPWASLHLTPLIGRAKAGGLVNYQEKYHRLLSLIADHEGEIIHCPDSANETEDMATFSEPPALPEGAVVVTREALETTVRSWCRYAAMLEDARGGLQERYEANLTFGGLSMALGELDLSHTAHELRKSIFGERWPVLDANGVLVPASSVPREVTVSAEQIEVGKRMLVEARCMDPQFVREFVEALGLTEAILPKTTEELRDVAAGH